MSGIAFQISDDVFKSLMSVEGPARDERIATFATCFGKDVTVLDSAFKDEMERRKAAAVVQGRLDRINAKMVKVKSFDDELNGFTVSESIVKLLDRAAAMETALADDDGKMAVMLRFEKDGDRWRIRAVGKAIEPVVAQAATQDGRGTKYNYFDDGRPVHGNLKPHILGTYPGSTAAKLLKDHDAGIKKGSISAFDAAMKDETLKTRITRVARD